MKITRHSSRFTTWTTKDCANGFQQNWIYNELKI